jgi:zinc-ribbon domain
MNTCPQCNTAIELDDRFCSKCGTAIATGGNDPQHNDETEPSFVDLAVERKSDGPATPIATPPPTTQPVQPVIHATAPIVRPAPPIPQPIIATEPAQFSERILEEPASEIIEAGDDNRKNLYLIGAVVCAMFVLGVLYYWMFLSDDVSRPVPPVTVATKPIDEKIEATALFAVTQANIRNRASTKGSDVVGKLVRGAAANGRLALGEDGTSNWLELSDGRGFVSAVNLSETAPPKLIKELADRILTVKEPIDIWAKPDNSSNLLLRVPAGGKLTLIGVTATDFLEVKMKQGGVGYVAKAGELLAMPEVTAPPIAMRLSVASCGYGPELDGMIAKLFTKAQAYSKAVEDADYPDDEARNAALGNLSNKQYFQRLERSYAGLTVTGVSQHYESTSVFFAEPADTVIAAFKAQGNKVDSGGRFPDAEVTGASINTTSGSSAAYGKSELSCGV